MLVMSVIGNYFYFGCNTVYLCFIQHQQKGKAVSQHTYGGARGRGCIAPTHSRPRSALDGGEWSASRPGVLAPGKGRLHTHCAGGWMGPREGLDTEVRRKISCLCRGSNLDRPVV
jgi:hypothetical protein